MENSGTSWLQSLWTVWQSDKAATYRLMLTVFATVFLAELGDKTQLATLLFATNAEVNKWLVFAGSALALVLTSAI
ncbi:MAG: TMEM165/GDT1 family protein, partial [Oscillatoriales cyanobacterium SM2_1_8]|nr:TMEM165/GDT1 family protein [Oscillatoriales cyanobacterium SM2_1_8]